jgi:hypothetical protein
MKKLILLSLIITAPAFGWDFKSLWNLKPSIETVNNAWQSMSPAMQKVTIAAGVVAAGGAVYAAWPIKKQAAYEKAEQCAAAERKEIVKNIDKDEENIKYSHAPEQKGLFHYGWFWQRNKYFCVSTTLMEYIDPEVGIIHIFGKNKKEWEKLTYVKDNRTSAHSLIKYEQNGWSRKNTAGFFNDIKSIHLD